MKAVEVTILVHVSQDISDTKFSYYFLAKSSPITSSCNCVGSICPKHDASRFWRQIQNKVSRNLEMIRVEM